MKNDALKLQQYIEQYWDSLLIVDTKETKTSLGLPNPFYAPSTENVEGFSFPYMFYWDSYFIAQGLFDTDREIHIKGIIENMFDLIRRFGFVPNSTSFSHLSRSQPPFLSSLVVQYIEQAEVTDEEWLLQAYARLSEEYRTAWLGVEQPHIRLVHKGLSRYFDTNILHALAEAESGWDYTTRFDDTCLDYLPIDLNALLYKYEQDLEHIARILGKDNDVAIWQRASERRKLAVNELMWHEGDGMFYDYNYREKCQGSVMSLAAYVPLFAGLASPEQAARMVENLNLFETDHGLTTTKKEKHPTADKQWASPNGWAPLHDIVVDGLLSYGYEDEAVRIAGKWLHTVSDSFSTSAKLYEKYNVVNPQAPAGGALYPDQHGFGWTNGVTAKFINFLASSEQA